MTDAETSPLGRKPTQTRFESVDTNDLTEHYRFATAGIYANHEYGDISLLRRKQN
jgi:hypothetical protein